MNIPSMEFLRNRIREIVQVNNYVLILNHLTHYKTLNLWYDNKRSIETDDFASWVGKPWQSELFPDAC